MTGNPEQVAAFLRRVATRLPEEMLAAEQANAETVFAAAVRWSSGPFSSADLARMGHPYAHGRTPPADPGQINVQSGELVNSWRQDGPKLRGGDLVTKIDNTAPHATFLETGTAKMIARPLPSAVLEETEAAVRRRREEAVRKAFRG